MIDLVITVMKETNTHPLPARKEAGRYHKGDPVDVHIDSGGPRRPNGSPKFVNVYVADFDGTLVEAKNFYLEEHRNAPATQIPDQQKMPLLGRRKRSFDALTIGQVLDLDRDGYITVTKDEFDKRVSKR